MIPPPVAMVLLWRQYTPVAMVVAKETVHTAVQQVTMATNYQPTLVGVKLFLWKVTGKVFVCAFIFLP